MKLKQELISVLKKDWKIIISGVCLISITIFLDVIQPIVTKKIIDDGILNKDFSIIISMGYILFCIVISKAVFDYLGNATVLKASINFLSHLNSILIRSLFNKKRVFYSKNPNGEIMEKTLEVWNLEDSVSANTIYSLMSILNLFVTIGVLLYYSVPVTIFIVFVSILLLFVMKSRYSKLRKYSENYYQHSGEIVNNLSENIYGMDEITNLNSQLFFENRFLNGVSKKLDSFRKLSRLRFLSTNLISSITSVMYLCILIFVGHNIVSGSGMTLGMYTLIISYASRIMAPIMEIGNIMNELQPLKVMYNRLKSIVECDNLLLESEATHTLTDDIVKLDIRNLTFSYDGNNNILSNVCMSFKNNEISLIKGRNGTGKSTLFKLILKYYNNYEGEITLNNININKIDTSNIIYQTLQNPYIFNMSIKQNIILDKKYDEQKYEKMIKLLGLNEVFLREDLYDDIIIEENGKSLSGGQIKLIELARIYYRNSKIILLDEILANIDNELVHIIIDGIKELAKEKIIVIIDHNNSFDFLADNIYFI